jgi:L-asparagine oxygenase
MKSLPVNFNFTDSECSYLKEILLSVDINPYSECGKFINYFNKNAKNIAPNRLIDEIESWSRRDLSEAPFLYIKNAPIDDNTPIFSHDDPVHEKRLLKKTFVSEGFLELFAAIRGIPSIGYKNVNDGDVYQDIYPKKDLFESQSQKALGPIRFHKDLANHFVRPDFVNILAIRSSIENEIYTTFVANAEAISSISENDLDVLKSRNFTTPFDDLSIYGAAVPLGEPEKHAVVQPNGDFRYFETRTKGLTDQAQKSLDRLTASLHRLKCGVIMAPGDFVSIANNHSLHGKDVYDIRNPDAAKIRWSIKTVNVFSVNPHKDYLADSEYPLVVG